MENTWNIQTHSQKKVRRTQTFISVILATLGIVILGSQAIPLISSYTQGLVEQKRAEVKIRPVPESYSRYIEEEFAYYDPGQSYFANLSRQLGNLDILGASDTEIDSKFIINKEYAEPMYVTIDSVGITNIKISPNVESSDESVYNEYLKSGVAHFKGTPLPGDGGNSFVYGHSAVEAFFNRHRDLPETIFSRLNGIDIGEKIVVQRDGKILEYIVRNKKIVEPEDFTVLQPVQNKETLTLMTCWPLGIGSKRLIVVGERRL